METKKTELPREIRINENKSNRQLRTIVQTTKRWLDLLFHECNGLVGNVKWMTQMMGEDATEAALPKAVFKELNQNTQNNIDTLKAIQQYIQILNVVAEKDSVSTDSIILNKPMLVTSVPGLAANNVSFDLIQMEVTRDFARVVSFLLQKLLEYILATQANDRQLHISMERRHDSQLVVRVAGSALFWHHEFWEKRTHGGESPLQSRPDQWPRLMFYELLDLVGAKILSGCSEPRDFTSRVSRPKLASELISQEISSQFLAFSIPLDL